MKTYETHIMKNPELPFIFHRNIELIPSAFNSLNWHENLEILLVASGEGVVRNDATHHNVQKGDLVIINTNSLHNVRAVSTPFVYHCLIVDRTFCLANYFDTSTLRFPPQLRDEALASLFDVLLTEYEENRPYRTQAVRGTVLTILARLCRLYGTASDSPHTDVRAVACIKRAIGYIRSNSEQDVSLDKISAEVGLSKYYFAREFRKITGHTFVTYVNTVRCEKAKALLSENRLTIGEISRATGFANQSYFTRTFRAHTGLLPGAYREQQLKRRALP